MSQPTDHTPGVSEIEADIARTREQLASTVDELAGRLDVKSRVRGQVAQTKQDATAHVRALADRATDDDGRPMPPVMVGAVAVAAVAVVALVVWWRGHR